LICVRVQFLSFHPKLFELLLSACYPASPRFFLCRAASYPTAPIASPYLPQE